MATTRKLVDLFRAIGSSDLEDVRRIAALLVKSEEKSGHPAAARLLRGALNGTTTASPAAPSERIADAQRANVVSPALTRLEADKPLSEVVLRPGVRAELEALVEEWKLRAELLTHGVPPRAKLLFHGPPGCGKSLTARALATELGLPIYMVRFDAVIGAFLGQTAMHLRQLFAFAEATPCVLLLDELDALGKKRGNPLDVGELDRIVISLMQELEHSTPSGMIVGTSNLPSHLDDALWRRFDLALEFDGPTKSNLRGFVTGLAASRGLRLKTHVMARALRSKSFAEAEAVVLSDLRRGIVLGARRR